MKNQEDLKEELSFVAESFYLWKEMDYNISVIGASMPFRKIARLKEITKNLKEKGLNKNTFSKIEGILSSMEKEGDKDILKPNLEKMKNYCDRLMKKYLILNLISKEDYVNVYDKIDKINKEIKNLPEDTQKKLSFLRERYKGKGNLLN